MFCAAGQIACVRALSSGGSGEPHESSLTASTHRQDSAIVPANALVRGGRAIGQLLSVPLAALLAFVALARDLVHQLGAPSGTARARRRHATRGAVHPHSHPSTDDGRAHAPGPKRRSER